MVFSVSSRLSRVLRSQNSVLDPKDVLSATRLKVSPGSHTSARLESLSTGFVSSRLVSRHETGTQSAVLWLPLARSVVLLRFTAALTRAMSFRKSRARPRHSVRSAHANVSQNKLYNGRRTTLTIISPSVQEARTSNCGHNKACRSFWLQFAERTQTRISGKTEEARDLSAFFVFAVLSRFLLPFLDHSLVLFIIQMNARLSRLTVLVSLLPSPSLLLDCLSLCRVRRALSCARRVCVDVARQSDETGCEQRMFPRLRRLRSKLTLSFCVLVRLLSRDASTQESRTARLPPSPRRCVTCLSDSERRRSPFAASFLLM